MADNLVLEHLRPTDTPMQSTFDTFKAARALESAGVERDQAEAIASAIGAQGVTRADLEPLATKAEMRWMFGFQAALILAMAAKLFGIV